ncbi:MAG TPA: hypothetical protein VH415_03615 [Nitrososphaeraceae archaeon]|jgi:hypothetical protein
MLNILDEIKTTIQEKVEGIGKQNIIFQKITPSKISTLPVVAIYDTGFTFDKIGIGEGMGITQEETEQEFSGDGSTLRFKLKKSAIRPLISVEVPPGHKLAETLDYTVDYLKNEVTLKVPAPKAQKGKNNVLITYSVAESAGETKGIRLKLVCNLDIWAKNSAQCDSIALDIIKSMLFAEDVFSAKNIHLKPLNGMNLSIIMDKDEQKKGDLNGRRLVYLAETDVKFESKVPQIRKIEISEKEWDKKKFALKLGKKLGN